jgi:hypothetical protein
MEESLGYEIRHYDAASAFRICENSFFISIEEKVILILNQTVFWSSPFVEESENYFAR